MYEFLVGSPPFEAQVCTSFGFISILPDTPSLFLFLPSLRHLILYLLPYISLSVCVCERERVCVCVCVCLTHSPSLSLSVKHTHTIHTHMYGQGQTETYRRISQVDLHFPRHVSPEAQDLIRKVPFCLGSTVLRAKRLQFLSNSFALAHVRFSRASCGSV